MSSIDLQINGNVATLLINNPEKKNALNLEMRVEITDHLRRIASDPAVRVVILTGAGTDFCSGSDVQTMGKSELAASRARLQILHRMILGIYQLEKPVIAAVRGAAVGLGWSMALACDMIIASESARFSQVFQKVGLSPDGGSSYFLTRELGFARAKDLIYSARFVNAAEALALGLVNQVVPDGELLAAAQAKAASLANSAPYTFALTKQMIHATIAPPLESFLELERLSQPQLTQTEDHKEAVRAFKEKRPPNFLGR